MLISSKVFKKVSWACFLAFGLNYIFHKKPKLLILWTLLLHWQKYLYIGKSIKMWISNSFSKETLKKKKTFNVFQKNRNCFFITISYIHPKKFNLFWKEKNLFRNDYIFLKERIILPQKEKKFQTKTITFKKRNIHLFFWKKNFFMI